VSDEFVWARDLPAFDEDAHCPKCGGVEVRTIYHLSSKRGSLCGFDLGHGVLDGHLCRVCERCGHGWCEAPADVKPPARPVLRLVAAFEAEREDAVPPGGADNPEDKADPGDKEGGGG
jgi:hypothetical protein